MQVKECTENAIVKMVEVTMSWCCKNGGGKSTRQMWQLAHDTGLRRKAKTQSSGFINYEKEFRGIVQCFEEICKFN